MPTPEVVSPPAHTADMPLSAQIDNPYPVDSMTRTCCGGIGTHTRDCQPQALAVRCPICDAQPDQLCVDAVRGWVQPVAQPHLYRVAIAEEVM